MKLNKISLDDRSLFSRYFGLTQELAAFSFANIFIWRCLYTIEWALVSGNLCVFFRDSLGCFMYLPALPGIDPQSLRLAFAHMNRINKDNQDISRIENIPQNEAGLYQVLGCCLRQKYPDYLCLRSDLESLRGNKFKSQRAAYNYFIKHNKFDLRPLEASDRGSCLELYDAWVNQRKAHCNETVYCGMLEDSRKVLVQALENYRALGFCGITVRVDSRLKGFSFGYKLNSRTFCVLYEITDLSIKGMAQFIFRGFCRELKEFKYINIMDDSGIENLRATKLAYKPEQLVPAYIASLR